MELIGHYKIPADRQRVWEALNDPAVLMRCIPGCEELAWVDDTNLDGTIAARIGPLTTRFAGRLTLSDLNPPETYTLKAEGQGGLAGLARGSVRVQLTEEAGGTLLHYQGGADVDGKLAQLGARLIQGTAQKYADQFFASFSSIITETTPASLAEDEVSAPDHADAMTELANLTARIDTLEQRLDTMSQGINPWIWAMAIVTLVALLVAAFG
ncbi:MAG: carbon monoxide dehydrogenase subunit G [Pseudomonadota bacterium]